MEHTTNMKEAEKAGANKTIQQNKDPFLVEEALRTLMETQVRLELKIVALEGCCQHIRSTMDFMMEKYMDYKCSFYETLRKENVNKEDPSMKTHVVDSMGSG